MDIIALKLKKSLLKGLGFLLIAVTAISWGFAARHIAERNTPVNFDAQTTNLKIESDKNLPVSIELKNQNILLPVVPRAIVNGKWDDPQHSVGYWIDSPIPGDHGNSVMYGHNWPNILGKLQATKKGDIFTIKYVDGQSKDFEVESTYVITADQTHILNQTDDSRLTIYTCTGFLDSKRFAAIAIPK